jgi:hypothetical protein
VVVGGDEVSVRPTGGDALLEASIEGRWWLAPRLQAAAFVDYGVIHGDPLALAGAPALEGGWTRRVSPGIGLRILANIGPIRLDVGYDPSGPERHPLFAAGDGDLRFLGSVVFDPFGHDDSGRLTRFLRRLQFHVDIGLPF